MTVFTHRRPDDTDARAAACSSTQAAEAGVTLRLDAEETRKHGARSRGPGWSSTPTLKDDVELCVVLGGDGTILRALQRYAGTDVPVFAINFGEIGFLATVEPRRHRGRHAPRARGRLRAAAPAGDRRSSQRAAAPRSSRSTTSRSTARSASASPRSPTRSTARSSAASAATGSSSRPRRARPATTSPTAGP